MKKLFLFLLFLVLVLWFNKCSPNPKWYHLNLPPSRCYFYCHLHHCYHHNDINTYNCSVRDCK